MTQKFDHPAKKVLIAGSGGTGKTTLLEKLVRKHRAQWKFIYDHQEEFGTRFGIETQHYMLPDVEDKVCRKGWVNYNPSLDFPGDYPTGFTAFCQYIYGMAQVTNGVKILCCDEMQMLSDNRTEPTDYLKCVEGGRRLQIDVFLISSSPNALHNRVLNGMSEVYAFQLTTDPAVKWIQGLGFDAEEVKNLGKYEYVHKNIRTGQFDRNFAPKNSPPPAEGGKAVPADPEGA